MISSYKTQTFIRNIKNFLLDIQSKSGDIANEIVNAAIDTERTFKCMWPNIDFFIGALSETNKVSIC